IDEVHAAYRRRLFADLAIHGFHHISGAWIGFADEQHVGEKHISHDAAKGDELRVVAEPDLHADTASGRRFERLADFAITRAWHYGARDVHDVVILRLAQRLADLPHCRHNVLVQERTVRPARRRDDDKRDAATENG